MRLLDKGAEKNAKEMTAECTPLHFASLFGHTDVASELIRSGASTDAKVAFICNNLSS